ncbi:ACP S-malonyltransferase [Streptomyces sp. Wb2n-11]|uniref:ACP S-malonyltransferase n=1 Tax=Streptomyces sp. Wb2n-11 TaxID=1030533 RepID=UPI000AB0B45D|nr:ACP S-malonyltransferase [Streptomyces sp. Wb2n-11]
MNRTAAFVFPGQGAQRPGMSAELLALHPELAGRYHSVADAVLGLPLSQLCLRGPARDLDDPPIAQPAVFLTSLMTLEVLRSYGVEPRAVAGHSLGHYTALTATGVLEWTEALRLVRLRGELMASVDDRVPGSTAAVLGLDRFRVQRLCAAASAATARVVEVTGHYGPGGNVVSGEDAAVEHVTRAARRAGAARVLRLTPGGAFHSSLLRDIEEEYADALATAEFHDPDRPLMSGATGQWLTSGAEAAATLRGELTRSVRWSDAVEALAATGADRFVEVGPGCLLGGLIRRALPAARVHSTGSARQLASTISSFAPAYAGA